MTASPISSRVLSPLLLVAATALSPCVELRAQLRTESFESHLYNSGALAGDDLWSGQHGWILLEPNYPANLAGAAVQSSVVRSGAQAVRFDASQFATGSFVELRRNEPFSLTTGVIEIELDFLITSSSDPSEWEIYSQPYPIPDSCYLRWWIAEDGRVEYLDTPQRALVQTNFFVTKDTWHHARTVVDVFGDRTEIHIDGQLVATGTPIGVFFTAPDHGFTQINAWESGDDAFYFDNFTVRERTAASGLTVDLPKLPIGQRSLVELRLAGGAALANRDYAIVASISGTSPGTPIGSTLLPLNWDGFASLIVQNYGTPGLAGFLGTCNQDGNAYATFDTGIPVPAFLLGLDIDFAYVTMGPFDAASEPARCTVGQ